MMDLQEREIELKYINKMIDRLSEKGDMIYKMSVAHKYDNYAFISSSAGTYDFSVEQSLEKQSLEWQQSEEGKKYVEVIEKVAKLQIIKSQLEKDQEDFVIDKYKIEI
jgi:hypothetical protein